LPTVGKLGGTDALDARDRDVGTVCVRWESTRRRTRSWVDRDRQTWSDRS